MKKEFSQTKPYSGVHTCEPTDLIPIYPVRYAYANFFKNDLEEVHDWPILPDLMKANDIPQGKGYVLRLLRNGWIYLQEEGGEEVFHIFKYTKEKLGNNKVVERFTKKMFRDGKSAKGGLKDDTSGRRDAGGNPIGYPFVFVKKGVKKISIAYSEHEWGAAVINKVRNSVSERKKRMQEIDLGKSIGPHSIKFEEANLEKLVEDYRRQDDRFLNYSKSTMDISELKNLSELTTEESYGLDCKKFAEELRIRTDYAEEARIVLLFDPIGRQRDIIYAHNTLLAWKAAYSGINTYPVTIAGMVNRFLKSKSEKIKKWANERINTDELNEEMSKINKELKRLDDRLEKIMALYEAFMSDEKLKDKLGSLNNYFKALFKTDPWDPYLGYDQQKDAVEKEVEKLCKLGGDIFLGITASAPAQKTMENMLSAISEHEAPEQTSKGFDAFLHSLTKVITTPQEKIKWSQKVTGKADHLLRALGPAFGALYARGESGTNPAKQPAYNLIAKKLIPALLGTYGLEIISEKPEYISGKAMNDAMNEFVNQSSHKGGTGKIDEMVKAAEQKIKPGQQLFDWDKMKSSSDVSWKVSNIQLTKGGKPARFIFSNKNKHVICFCFDNFFTGLSAFMNVKTITEIMGQSRFEEAETLKQSNQYFAAVNLFSAATALTADVIQFGQAWTKFGTVISNSPSLLKALAPSSEEALASVAKTIGSKTVTGLIAAANVTAMIYASWEAYNAFQEGSIGVGAGHSLMAAGTGLLVYDAVVAAGSTASTGIGWPVAVGILLIGAGAAMTAFFKKSQVELVLENCFWGKSTSYGFWQEDYKKRPDISDRLKRARDITDTQTVKNYYHMELQEFMNLLYMPELKYERSKLTENSAHTYKFKFILPNFQPGVSNIDFGIYADKGIFKKDEFKQRLTDAFKQKMDDIIENEFFEYNYGSAVFEIEMKVIALIPILRWIYRPTPAAKVPMRFLTSKGILKEVALGMRNEKFV